MALCDDTNTETAIRAGSFTEPTGGGYARVEVTEWEQAASGTTGAPGDALPLPDDGGRRVRPRTLNPVSGSGPGVVDFVNTGGADWGNITYVLALDQTGGVVDYQVLTEPRFVRANDVLRFSVGSLQFGRKWD